MEPTWPPVLPSSHIWTLVSRGTCRRQRQLHSEKDQAACPRRNRDCGWKDTKSRCHYLHHWLRYHAGPYIPILGEGGGSFAEVWDPYPESYFGIFVPKMPNMLRFVGPNGAPGAGGFVHLIERVCEYMDQGSAESAAGIYRVHCHQARAMAMLTKHIDKYFTKTIHTRPCKS